MAGQKKDRKWIQKAIKHPGSFRAYAAKHGGLTKDGRINKEWARQVAKRDDVWGRRARFFLHVLDKLRPR